MQETKADKKKTFRYVKYAISDCVKAFPGLMLVLLLFGEAAMDVATVARPALLAGIMETAAGDMEHMADKIVLPLVLFCIALLVSPMCNVISHWIFFVAEVHIQQYFGRKMFIFSKQIQLEELENPEILNKFKKAEKALEDQIILEMFGRTLQTISIIIVCGGIVALVGSYSPWLVVISLAGAVPSLLLQIYVTKIMTALRRGQSMAERRLQYLWELFTRKDAVKEMRTMGFAAYLKEQWTKENVQVVQEYREGVLSGLKKVIIGICINNLFYAANIAVSLWLMIDGQVSVGEFAACLMAFSSFQGTLQNLVSNITEVTRCYHLVEDYYDYFTIPTETNGTEEYKPFKDWISVDNVTFRYAGAEEDSLKGVTCTIYKGEHVVIVGENGSGKTTLSKLLTGAYLPRTGDISYDRQRTENLNRKSLYRHISMVSQDFVHYQFSLRENVGISDITRMQDSAAMERLLTDVTGAEFLDKIGGLDVQLGREFGGKELSGGEWQKLAIARGLWKDSDIVILDEPTSALDPLVEYDILSKFVEMIQNKTSIIISHRVGVCRTADKIIVMKDGRVVECGKHEELLTRNGEYSRIWSEQAKWYV